jgi:hypothetical protein
LNGQEKRTLGQIANELKGLGGDSRTVADGLDGLVDARNRLVHRVFLEPETLSALQSDHGRVHTASAALTTSSAIGTAMTAMLINLRIVDGGRRGPTGVA